MRGRPYLWERPLNEGFNADEDKQLCVPDASNVYTCSKLHCSNFLSFACIVIERAVRLYMGVFPVCISGIICMHRKHNACHRSSMGAAIFPNFDQTLAVLYLPAFA